MLAEAIRELRVRGAPVIGVAAAYAAALGAQAIPAATKEAFWAQWEPVCQAIADTRPTARNLFWALERLKRVAQAGQSVTQIKAALLAEAQTLEEEDEAICRRLGQAGAALIPEDGVVLTHCNAGALATVAYGTALGVVRAAWEQGKRFQVFATETRPVLQGARLTAWELMKDGIPVTLIADTMAGYFMRQGTIDVVIVGADRIARNGDTANKIGTFQLAVLAMEHGIPFYVAAPLSTFDLSLATGDEIPIEERRPEEVTTIAGVRIAPEGVAVRNPAFDVTPHQYISGIVTEAGVLREPYEERLRQVVGAGA